MGRVKKLFWECALNPWLDGYSVIPIKPHTIKLYEGFDYRPFEKRQPTIQELLRWSKEFPGSGVGIVVNYSPDRQTTIETVKAMGDLDRIMDVPILILFRLKDFLEQEGRTGGHHVD